MSQDEAEIRSWPTVPARTRCAHRKETERITCLGVPVKRNTAMLFSIWMMEDVFIWLQCQHEHDSSASHGTNLNAST